MCPRLDPNNDITARGFVWTSPDETVDNFVGCLYTDNVTDVAPDRSQH